MGDEEDNNNGDNDDNGDKAANETDTAGAADSVEAWNANSSLRMTGTVLATMQYGREDVSPSEKEWIWMSFFRNSKNKVWRNVFLVFVISPMTALQASFSVALFLSSYQARESSSLLLLSCTA